MCNTTNTRRPAHLFYGALANWKNAAIEVEAVCPDDNEDKYEQEVDRLADIASALQEAVFKYAAPDMAAVIAKLELAISSPEFIQIDYIRNAIEDLANLAGVEKSPAFVPTVWLSLFERRGGYFDYEPVSGKITLSANYTERQAMSMVNQLSDIEREALRAAIIGNNAKGGDA